MSASAAAQPGVAIAGGGIIGLSIAWRLAQRGWNVTVYDKSIAGGEASWAAAGMLAPGGEFHTASELASMGINSRCQYSEFVRELQAISGCPIDYQECGALDLAYSDEEWAGLQERLARQASMGLIAKPVSAAQARAFWPRLRTEGLAGALFYPGDAVVNPRDAVLALRRACEGAGVAIRERCEVSRIAVGSGEVEVRSGGGTDSYSAFVLAAGAWSNLVEVHGVPPIPAVEPVRGHLIGYRQPPQTCGTIVRRGHAYMLQRCTGMLIAGASAERAGFDRAVSQPIVENLRRNAEFLFPHLAETAPSEVWTGFRPASDELQIGAWHSPRLMLAYGHFRNGVLLTPVTAARIASEISANLETPQGARVSCPR